MSEQKSPPFRRRLLGRTLRGLREKARLTTTEVCARLEISAARLSRIENGQTAPDLLVVKALLDEYGIPVNDWEPYLDLAREARKKSWWQLHGLPTMGYVALESAANSVREFALAYLPGLLQTRDYAAAVLGESLLNWTRQQFEGHLAVRMRRQHRLTDPEDDFDLVAIVDEGALRRPVGGLEVMRAQLSHLAETAALPNVSLQVLPTAAGVHLGMASAFIVLGFPEQDIADIAYIAHVAGSLQLEKAEQVRDCKLTFDRLRDKALGPAESVQLIRRLAEP
ncbi:helix-turn-helix domain-containing protein [Amycolatopsis aidingensis]|uniref:helix-turn-helix domain-containing protein n=1 Tax=Amycolatopsis aidingensis TaxID=2842453 RepID=UPI001C0B59FD|nr:helix-turn-helix transcriptional regulator [Amycolatopsis aidingensis]